MEKRDGYEFTGRRVWKKLQRNRKYSFFSLEKEQQMSGRWEAYIQKCQNSMRFPTLPNYKVLNFFQNSIVSKSMITWEV